MGRADADEPVGFYYNKALFQQAGVDAATIKTGPTCSMR
jgi:hypothetical protein